MSPLKRKSKERNKAQVVCKRRKKKEKLNYLLVVLLDDSIRIRQETSFPRVANEKFVAYKQASEQERPLTGNKNGKEAH